MNNAKLFVGSLPWATTDEDLKNLFSEFGSVVSAMVIKDRQTGRSKGYGFVEMSSDEEAAKAKDALDGSDLEGRKIVVNIATPREDRPNR